MARSLENFIMDLKSNTKASKAGDRESPRGDPGGVSLSQSGTQRQPLLRALSPSEVPPACRGSVRFLHLVQALLMCRDQHHKSEETLPGKPMTSHQE